MYKKKNMNIKYKYDKYLLVMYILSENREYSI
jgi:hypothetical protein